MKKVKITDKDFEYFKKECLKWIGIMGLGDWDIDFLCEEMEDTNAECRYNIGQRGSTLVINLELGFEGHSKREEIKNCAQHEVCENVLAIIRQLAITNHNGSDIVNSEIHSLVNRIIKAMNYGKK